MNASTHPVAPEEIMALLDGELNPAGTASITAHLDLCGECRNLAAKLHSTSESLSRWQVEPLDSLYLPHLLETASSKVLSDIPAQVQNWLRPLQLLLSRPLPWALVCVVFVFLIGAQLLHQPRPSRESIFAKYKTSSTVPPPSSGPWVANQGYSGAAGGGNGAGDTSGFNSYEDSGRTSFDRATQNLHSRYVGGRVAQPAPMIARTVSLSIVAKDFEVARISLDAILARHNGYAAGLNVATPQGAARTLQASLRIPAPHLATALAELKALGRVEVETQNGEEVTQQHADLLARLKNSRKTEQRLQAILLQRTGKVSDVLAVEQEIARVRGEIEQMEAEQKNLEHRVDFATIDLKLAEEYKAQLSSPAPSVATQLRNATVNGFRNAFESLLALILFLAEIGPTLLIWALLLCFPAWLFWRRYQRAHSLGTSLSV